MAALLRSSEVAELLGLSRATVTRYIQARDFADRIATGERPTVPRDVAPYLSYGFPRPLVLGPKNQRIPADELATWLQGRRK